MHHEIKCWPRFFSAIRAGQKTYEVRKNDRGYEPGDTVTLLEWDPETEQYTGKSATFIIGWVVSEQNFPEALQPGFIVFALLPS